MLTLVTNSKCREGALRIPCSHGYLVMFLFGGGQTWLKPVSSPNSRRSRQEGPNLLGTRDLFRWRQFFRRLGSGDGFGTIPEHYKYQLVLPVWVGDWATISLWEVERGLVFCKLGLTGNVIQRKVLFLTVEVNIV